MYRERFILQGNLIINISSEQHQDRKDWIDSEGMVLIGKKLEDQKACMIKLCCDGKVASLESQLLRAFAPSDRCTIMCKKDTKDFTGIFDTGKEKITKTFSSLQLCITWLHRQDRELSKNGASSASSSSKDNVSQLTLI